MIPSMILAQPWPRFLDKLESAPQEAMAEFYTYLMLLLNMSPPRMFLALGENERSDFMQSFLLHTFEADFKTLKRYRDRGRPFSAWLTVVISNRCVDYLRSKKRNQDNLPSVPLEYGDYVSTLKATELTPFEKTAFSTLIASIQRCLDKLPLNCGLLIKLGAENVETAQICRLMKIPEDDNKKLSDKLRYCRKLLKDLLVREGIRLEDWL